MRPLIAVLIALAVMTVVPAAAPNPAEPALILRGKVVDMSGVAIPHARLVIQSGKKRSNASVDQSGAFALMLPLPTPERLRAAACSVRVFATTKGMRLVLPNGDPALSVLLRIERADSADKVVASSNDERVAAMAALAVATRKPLAEVEGLRLMGLEGERIGDPPSVLMPHVAQVAVMPLPVAAPVAAKPPPAKPPPAKPTQAKTSTAAKPVATTGTGAAAPPSSAPKPPATPSTKSTKGGSSTSAAKPPATKSTPPASKSGTTIVTVTTPADSHAVVAVVPPIPTGPPECGCRIKGTVELVANPPPTEPVVVVVWVDGAPTLRTSVELALGSPRPFELLDVPCGPAQLRVQVSAERSYVLRSPELLEGLSCTRGGLLQPRIVLVPRKGF